MTKDQAEENLMRLAYSGPVALEDVQFLALVASLEACFQKLQPEVVEVLRTYPGVRCGSYDCKRPLALSLAYPCSFRICPGYGVPKEAERAAWWVRRWMAEPPWLSR